MNFFAICLEFSITHWIGTKRSETIICIFPLSRPFLTNFILKRSPNSFFLIFWIFLQFFMNFLLRVWLERNGMIIFLSPVSRSIPTYYGLKWSQNDIFLFLEFFYYFFWIFYYALGRNETERKFLFSIFLGLFQPILALNEATVVFF